MPRKAKTETAIKTTAATKNKTKSVKETPKGSQIILEYSRNGNLGLSRVVETVNIPFLTQKKFAGKITSLFHFVRSTSVSHDLDSGRTATFQLEGKPLLSITQKAGDYDKQIFTLTKYKTDGTKQITRKYDYGKTRNLIFQVYGFEIKTDTGIDDESGDLLAERNDGIGNDTELLPDTDFEYDIDNKFTDME